MLIALAAAANALVDASCIITPTLALSSVHLLMKAKVQISPFCLFNAKCCCYSSRNNYRTLQQPGNDRIVQNCLVAAVVAEWTTVAKTMPVSMPGSSKVDSWLPGEHLPSCVCLGHGTETAAAAAGAIPFAGQLVLLIAFWQAYLHTHTCFMLWLDKPLGITWSCEEMSQ